jgi:beta propeller repeat protein
MNKKEMTSIHAVVNLKHPAMHRTSDISKRLTPAPQRYPAQAPVRVFAVGPQPAKRGGQERVTLLSSWQMFCARIVAGMLIPLTLLHPVAHVYADEVVSPDATPSEIQTEAGVATDVPPPVVEVVATPLPVETPVEEVVSDPSAPAPDVTVTEPVDTPPTEEGDTEVPVTPEPDPVNTDTGTEPPVVVVDGGTSDDAPVPPPDTTLPVVVEENTPDDQPGSIGGGGGDVPVASSTTTENLSTETPPDEISTAEETATSTDIAVEDIPRETATEAEVENTPSTEEEPPIVLTSANDLVPDEAVRTERLRTELRREIEQEFLRGCISFETSGYYCLNDGARKPTASTSAKTPPTVESSQGDGGDKEIFVTRDGVRIALTDNDWDDSFPTQDASGKQFVWQGMKGGRWQIFQGELSDAGLVKVTQITDSRESNFNPKIDGEHIVWQGWADENWEIFMATRRSANSPLAEEHLPEGNALLNVSTSFSVERLTKNKEHDMFPSLHGDIVTWQSRRGVDWVVSAYSISVKTATQLSSDGAKGENPRFALTWEERDQYGNTRLVGYDMSTGEKTDITSMSRSLTTSPYGKEDTIPVTHTDPIALPPPSSTGSSTVQRGSDDDTGDNPLLP